MSAEGHDATTAGAGADPRQHASAIRHAALLAVAYFLVAAFGHTLSPWDDVQGFFWLPAGLLVGSLLLTRRRDWPALLAGALVGDAAFGLLLGLAPSAITLRFGLTAAQAVMGAALVEGFGRKPFRLDTPRDLLVLLFFATFEATFVVAVVGVAILVGDGSFDEFTAALWPRWGSNAMGVLLVAPHVLAWSEFPGANLGLDTRARRVEALLLLFATLASVGVVFLEGGGIQSPLRVLLTGPAVWAALRFGLRGATALHLALALPVAFFTGAAISNLSVAQILEDGISPAQTLLSMLSSTGLALALVLRESGVQLATLGRSEKEVRRLSRLYASLSAVNRAVVREATVESFFETTCRSVAEEGGMMLAGVGRASEDRALVEPVAYAGPAKGYLDGVEIALASGIAATGPAAMALRSGKPHVSGDSLHDPEAERWRTRAARHGIHAMAAFPIRCSGGVWGVFGVYAAEAGFFGDKEVCLLEEIADNIGFALDNFAREAARREAEDALAASEALFRLAMRGSPIGMAIVATDGRWLEANSALCQIVGYRREELLRSDFQAITHPEDLAGDLDLMDDVLAGRRDTYRLEKRYIRKNGSEVWIQLDVGLVRDGAGTPQYFLSQIQDIGEQREARRRVLELNQTLEHRVAERTSELEEANRELELANRELEAFSASVSHDLRAPLRRIDGFSQLIAREHLAADDETGHADVGRIRSAAKRMDDLIDSMLRLARVTRGRLQRDPVDLGAMADEILAAFRGEDPSREVSVKVAPGLVARGHEELLRSVMENLLGNAWKFTSKTDGAEIEVGVEEHDGEAMFFVADNGAGFNPAFADQLFRAFHRLHEEDEFPGHGIGLATVQRILQRHGGRIVADSEEGEGATFWFTTAPR